MTKVSEFHTIQFSRRKDSNSQSFIASNAKLWNSLPPGAFPKTCNLQKSKENVGRLGVKSVIISFYLQVS